MKKQYLIIVSLVILFSACMSVPKKNLDTGPGLIAAQLGVEVKEVKEFKAGGYSDDEIIKILIISESSYLSLDEVKKKLNNAERIKDISQNAGIEEEILNREANRIKESIANY